MNATVAGIVIDAPKPKMSRDQKLMTKMVIADQYYNGKEVTQYVIAMAFDKNAKYINNYVKKGDAVYLTGLMINQPYMQANGRNRYYWFFKIETIKILHAHTTLKQPQNNPFQSKQVPQPAVPITPKESDNKNSDDDIEMIEFEGMDEM